VINSEDGHVHLIPHSCCSAVRVVSASSGRVVVGARADFPSLGRIVVGARADPPSLGGVVVGVRADYASLRGVVVGCEPIRRP
jgi:hypothetical protein